MTDRLLARPPDVTLRSPMLVWHWLVVTMLALSTGAAVLLSGDPIEDSVLGLLLITIPSTCVAIRVPFMRVVLTHRGLAAHGLIRNRHVGWSMVESVSVRRMFRAPSGPSVAPVLSLRGERRLELMMLSTLCPSGTPRSFSRVAQQRETIAAWAAGHQLGVSTASAARPGEQRIRKRDRHRHAGA